MSIDSFNPISQECADGKQEIAAGRDLSDRLHDFFTNPSNFRFERKNVFCAGTAPMRDGNSEIPFLLRATDFDKAVLVDPNYVDQRSLSYDMQALRKIIGTDENIQLHDAKIQPDGKLEIRFKHNGKEIKITFVAGDAIKDVNMPQDFNIYFSGRRVCIDENTKKTPSDEIEKIINQLPDGGYLLPDRDLRDEASFFRGRPPSELSLKEVVGIRQAPKVVEGLDISESDRLRNQYFNEAVAAGKISPKPIFLGVKYQTIDSFFESHPDFKKEDFVVVYIGLFHKESDMEIPFDVFSAEEEKIVGEIESRSEKEATKEKTIRGVGLYQKVKE